MKVKCSSLCMSVLGASIANLFLFGCAAPADGPSGSTGGTMGSGGAALGSGGVAPGGSGGQPASGGSTGSGGGSGGQSTGGDSATGGVPGTGGRGTGGAVLSTGGAPSTGSGGMTGTTGGTAAGATAAGGRNAAGGSTATGGAGGASATTSKPSAGCGMTTSQALNQWVESMPAGSTRPYSVRLPTGYSAGRAYPVIVLLHGCGSGTNNVPMEKATGTDAILIRGTGSAADTCWTTTANGADVAFFDAMVADVKARFCADENRFYAVGYSSGSWLVNQLTCIRSSVLRGAATVTGGESAGSGCKGPVSRIFIHDLDDTTDVISGSERARDRQLTQNGCDKTMTPVAQNPSPCVGYPGCPTAYPVVWCATSGQMHNRQDSLAPTTFWNFFKQF